MRLLPSLYAQSQAGAVRGFGVWVLEGPAQLFNENYPFSMGEPMSVKDRGFGSIKDPKLRSQLAAEGGRAAKGRYKWNSNQAREAGEKGLAQRRKNKAQRDAELHADEQARMTAESGPALEE